jgi:hypothetical protein
MARRLRVRHPFRDAEREVAGERRGHFVMRYRRLRGGFTISHGIFIATSERVGAVRRSLRSRRPGASALRQVLVLVEAVAGRTQRFDYRDYFPRWLDA